MTKQVIAVSTLALALLLAGGRPAHAQTQSAKALYESGTAKYNLGDWKGALDDFKAAYLLRNDPVFLFNIAQCYRQLNDYANAALEYRAYLREAPDAPNRDEVKRLLGSMEAAMQRQNANQPPTGVAPPAGIATSPPPAPTPPPPAPTTPPPDHGRAERLAGISLMAGGGGLLVLGAVFVGLAKTANDDAGANGVYDPSAISQRDGYEIGDAICFAVGGVAAATGIVLFVLGRRARSERVAIDPVVSPRLAGARLTVRF